MTVLFVIFLLSFIAICYIAWRQYVIFAQYLDPSGQCIAGFILPVTTAFIATLNWSALSVIGSLQVDSAEKYLGRFDFYSLLMIFIIFLLGALTWGTFMKLPDYDDNDQENVAASYTILSYWFGFLVFSWAWLLMERMN